MAYTARNYATKKALIEAVKRGERVSLASWPPPRVPAGGSGTEYIEGPHGVHKWYAQATIEDGIIVKVK